MTIREIVATGIAGVGLIGMSILGGIIHIWTIVIAYMFGGLIGALITLALPVIAEIYWFFKIGLNIGFGTYYCLAIIAYVLFFILIGVGGIFAGD